MLKAQDGMSSSEFHSRTIQSRLDEIEGRFSQADRDNAQLRKDKQILVEHIAQLQNKVSGTMNMNRKSFRFFVVTRHFRHRISCHLRY